MYRKLFLILTGCLMLASMPLNTASAQQTGNNTFMVDKVVAVVGNSAIYYSDVMSTSEQIREMWRKQRYTSGRDAVEEAFEALLMQKLLYNQSQIDSLQVNMNWVNSSVNYIVDSLVKEAGSVKDLEERTGKALFDIRQDYRDKMMEQELASSMERTVKSEITITPGEVDRFYRKISKEDLPIIPEQYIYAHITKYPLSQKAAQQRVRETLLELRERVINGERFDMLARVYSIDGSRVQGGEMDYMTLEQLVTPFADALRKMNVGQVSEVVETEYGYHIIQLIDKQGDKYKARHILMRPQYTDQELQETKDMLDSLSNEIKAGTITFEDAALKYSDDKYSRKNGGRVNNHEYLEFTSFYANIAYSMTKFTKEMMGALTKDDHKIVPTLKVGEISKATFSKDLMDNELVKIIKLIEIIPSHYANLNDDYLEIEQLALAEKEDEYFDEWLDKKIDATYIRIDDMFKGMTFENPKWNK